MELPDPVNELEDGEEQSRGDDGALLEGNEELFPGYEYQYEPSRLEEAPFQPLWRTWDQLAQKSGTRHMVYWAKPCGNTYKGDWENNKKNGPGTQTWGNGYVYEGEWRDDKPHGSGTLWFKKGNKLVLRYRGNFAGNKKEGYGVYKYPSGEIYEGEWLSGLRSGQGRHTYKNADVYDGQWAKGNRQGTGALYRANGDVYRGEWANDKKNGSGTFFYREKRKRYDGLWVDDIAKCGVYGDLDPQNYSTEPHPIPKIELMDPLLVLEESAATLMPDADPTT